MTALGIACYRLFEAVLGRTEPLPAECVIPASDAQGDRTGLAVYAATMGEFQVARPIVDRLRAGNGGPLLVLVGQAQYVDAVTRVYPDASVLPLPSLDSRTISKLLRHNRIALTVFAEGPCEFKRFPIRSGMQLPMACLAAGVPVVIVNACMYELAIESRVAGLERRLFGSLFRRAIHHWYAPSPTHAAQLVEAGIPEAAMTTVGDIKFDVLESAKASEPAPELSTLLASMATRWGRFVVGGSVNAIDEQTALVDGWLRAREHVPELGLVIAPRYVNNPDVMAALADLLTSRGIAFASRSTLEADVGDAEVVIVDVFGELMHYYAHADVAYIGRNHGVLEPLGFGLPVVVAPRADWRAGYSAYPLFLQMIDDGAIIELADKAALGDVLIRLLTDGEFRAKTNGDARRAIETNRGSADRIVADLVRCGLWQTP